MMEKWIIMAPDRRYYGPFETQDEAAEWGHKQWPEDVNQVYSLHQIIPVDGPGLSFREIKQSLKVDGDRCGGIGPRLSGPDGPREGSSNKI